jgi:NAD(P)H-nitrite reductase large subunit
MGNRHGILIVGGGIAGVSAALGARALDKSARITIIGDEGFPPYRRPDIPIALERKGGIGDVGTFVNALSSNGVKLLRGKHVCKIDPEEGIVEIVGRSRKKSLPFDSLVVATGSRPYIPPIPGLRLKGVFSFRYLSDAIQMSKFVKPGQSAVIVGGGLIGLLLSVALIHRSVRATVCEAQGSILPKLLDPDLSFMVEGRLKSRGVRFVKNSTVREILGTKEVRGVKFDGGSKVGSDLIVFCAGVRPNVELAQESGMRIGDMGIAVDGGMGTSYPNIYAAGECCETFDFITQRYTYMPLGSVSSNQGMLAGMNAAGGEGRTEGFVRMQQQEVFGMSLLSIGDIGPRKKREPISLDGEIFPMAKVLLDRERVVGAQAIFFGEVGNFGLLIYNAIKNRWSFSEFVERLGIAKNSSRLASLKLFRCSP